MSTLMENETKWKVSSAEKHESWNGKSAEYITIRCFFTRTFIYVFIAELRYSYIFKRGV